MNNILITGAQASGKSHLAKLLGQSFGTDCTIFTTLKDLHRRATPVTAQTQCIIVEDIVLSRKEKTMLLEMLSAQSLSFHQSGHAPHLYLTDATVVYVLQMEAIPRIVQKKAAQFSRFHTYIDFPRKFMVTSDDVRPQTEKWLVQAIGSAFKYDDGLPF
jgi:cytidylate kinase